ncbi:MAG: penicillin-binding protein activator LpoB [Treponema sp.]|jgi:uncharacterized protein (TIGR02722 family)|nr:penicillin-binding protein activator LpoB [Treponema sp.]
MKYLFIIVCAFLNACVFFPSEKKELEVNRVDSQAEITGRWSDVDVQEVCEALVLDCLVSPLVDQAISDYEAKHRRTKPTVTVGSFVNATMEHGIDTDVIADNIKVTLIRSGLFEFVASGTVREERRDEVWDQQFSASEETATALGKEIGAAFMLNGAVRSLVDGAGELSTRTYYVSAQLTDIETNKIIWNGEKTVRKQIRRAKATW